MPYDRIIKVSGTFDETVETVRRALADQGFGILSEIDVQATLKAKLGHDMEPYLILGACNPHSPVRPWMPTARSGCCFPATSWSAPTATR